MSEARYKQISALPPGSGIPIQICVFKGSIVILTDVGHIYKLEPYDNEEWRLTKINPFLADV